MYNFGINKLAIAFIVYSHSCVAGLFSYIYLQCMWVCVIHYRFVCMEGLLLNCTLYSKMLDYSAVFSIFGPRCCSTVYCIHLYSYYCTFSYSLFLLFCLQINHLLFSSICWPTENQNFLAPYDKKLLLVPFHTKSSQDLNPRSLILQPDALATPLPYRKVFIVIQKHISPGPKANLPWLKRRIILRSNLPLL